LKKFNIYETLRNSANEFPNQIAVVDEFGEITYNELFQETEKLIQWFQNKGVKEGIGVGIITGNNRHFIICLYAIVACNAIAMPISSKQKPYEIELAVKEGQIHFIVGDVKDLVALGDSKIEKISSEPTLYFNKTSLSNTKRIAEFIDSPAFIRFTSGTTGKAKGVIISHVSVLERINAANESLKITSDDKILWVLSMAYHFVVSIVLYIKNGATIIVNNDFMAEEIIASIQKYSATFFYGSPMHISMLAASKTKVMLPTLRTVISTTTGVSASVCVDFYNRYKIPVRQAFGIIEVGLPIINSDSSNNPEAVGFALPAYRVAIMDENFKPLENNKLGLLCVSGPGMFDGYLSPPTKREKVLKNGWFITGDIAVMNDNGLITIKGRKKNVINVQGNKVFPNEVEEVINCFDGVIKSKAYASKHLLLGEVVAVDIESRKSLDKEEVISFCRKSLSSFKLPQIINFVDEIKMTDSGKIKR